MVWWYGVVWWYGMVWYGMVWYGIYIYIYTNISKVPTHDFETVFGKPTKWGGGPNLSP